MPISAISYLVGAATRLNKSKDLHYCFIMLGDEHNNGMSVDGIALDKARARRNTDRIKWTIHGLAIAISPAADMGRFSMLGRGSNPQERSPAPTCLIRSRLYSSEKTRNLQATGKPA
jgi:hypothetical protein